MDCGELLCENTFLLWLKGIVYKSYARPNIMHMQEKWCLRESGMGILKTE